MIILSLLLVCGVIALLLAIWSKGPWLESLYATGMLVVVIGFVVLVYLGCTGHGGYLLAAVGLVALWVVTAVRPMMRYYHRQREREIQRDRAILADICARRRCPLPRLEHDHQFGFPAFTLTFASLADRRRAEAAGGIAEFQ